MSDEKKEPTNCTNATCDQINRVIAALSFRHLVKDEDNSDDYIIDYFEQYQTLLNDWHHILTHHLSDHNSDATATQQFKLIHQKISKFVKCSVGNCESFQRNQLKFENNHSTDLKSRYHNDILDSVHCHFQHSYDLGYIVSDSRLLNDTNINIENSVTYTDTNTQKLKQRISQTKSENNITSYRYNRFGQSITGLQSALLLESEHSPVVSYYFGTKQHKQTIYHHRKHKYSNLKDELLSNALFKLNIHKYQISFHKAKKYMDANSIKGMISSDDKLCVKHNIKTGQKISVAHVFSLILYCDHQTLHDSLCQSFRDEQTREYWNWCKYLLQSVECFGKTLNVRDKFYYYLLTESSEFELNKAYFPNFNVNLCNPTSTTARLPVAIASYLDTHNENGIILELEQHSMDNLGYSKYVDCSLFSYHSNEIEKLFFGGLQPLRICNITDMKSNTSYRLFINAVTLLDDMINGRMITNVIENDSFVFSIAKKLLINDRESFPEYICNIFQTFCDEKLKIIIDLHSFRRYNALFSCFFNADNDNMLFITKLVQMFGNCTEIQLQNNKGNDSIDVSALFLTQLLIELNRDNEYIIRKSCLEKLVIINAKFDVFNENQKILNHCTTDYRQKCFDLVYETNDSGGRDILIKREKLTESHEYNDIRQYVQSEISKLLLIPSNEHGDQRKEYHEILLNADYKTPNDLLIDITDCIATNAYVECESVKRIKIVLMAYKKLMGCNKLWRNVSLVGIITFAETYTITQINDDFMHIQLHIDVNNAKTQSVLHKKFQNEFECLEENCKIKQGDRKRRAKYKYPKYMTTEDIVFQEQCDKMHSYLLHPYYEDDRASQKSANSINSSGSDQQKKGKGYIGKREDEMWWKWNSENKESKQDIDNEMKQSNDERIYTHLVEQMNIFRYQQAHGFTNEEHEGLMHIRPKYKDVKEEALYNPYYFLSKDNWNQTLRKAQVFFNSFARKRINTLYPGRYDDKISNTIEVWKAGVDINMKEIVTLKLYTDFDKLQFELKKCYRFDTLSDVFTLRDFNPALSKEEATSNQFDAKQKQKRFDLEERLRIFYWWRTKLLTVLIKFGQKLVDQKIPLYHGVNAKMILNRSLSGQCYGPLSTSASYHVARTFATAKGMVLQVTSQYPRLNNCRAFDASLISDYPEEKEWLVGFIYLRIIRVLTRPLNKNWKKFEDIDNVENDYKIPKSSETRDIFFAVHLFRQQSFSMSVHSEYYLSAFLYLFCGWDVIEERMDNNHIQKTRFLSVLDETRKSVVKLKKNNENQYRQHRILNILCDKFDNFRHYPNMNQVIRIDTISKNLLPYLKDFSGFDIHKKEKYVISFQKIMRIFPNCREIHFQNYHLFDNAALRKLIAYVTVNPTCALRVIKFLYFDFEVETEESNEKNITQYPTDPKIFCNPKQLNKKWINELKLRNWRIKHKSIDRVNTGYQIRIYKL